MESLEAKGLIRRNAKFRNGELVFVVTELGKRVLEHGGGGNDVKQQWGVDPWRSSSKLNWWAAGIVGKIRATIPGTRVIRVQPDQLRF